MYGVGFYFISLTMNLMWHSVPGRLPAVLIFFPQDLNNLPNSRIHIMSNGLKLFPDTLKVTIAEFQIAKICFYISVYMNDDC